MFVDNCGMEDERACVCLDDWRGLALGIITIRSGDGTLAVMLESCTLGAYPNVPQVSTTHRTQARILSLQSKIASGLSNPQNLLV
jgi:hypothetical protein